MNLQKGSPVAWARSGAGQTEHLTDFACVACISSMLIDIPFAICGSASGRPNAQSYLELAAFAVFFSCFMSLVHRPVPADTNTQSTPTGTIAYRVLC